MNYFLKLKPLIFCTILFSSGVRAFDPFEQFPAILERAGVQLSLKAVTFFLRSPLGIAALGVYREELKQLSEADIMEARNGVGLTSSGPLKTLRESLARCTHDELNQVKELADWICEQLLYGVSGPIYELILDLHGIAIYSIERIQFSTMDWPHKSLFFARTARTYLRYWIHTAKLAVRQYLKHKEVAITA